MCHVVGVVQTFVIFKTVVYGLKRLMVCLKSITELMYIFFILIFKVFVSCILLLVIRNQW